MLEVMPGRYLFALLKDMPNPVSLFFPGEAPVEMAPLMAELDAVGILDSDDFPLLVTFGDLSDPLSVRVVLHGDLATHFGPDARLRGMTLAITDEPVTEGRVKAVLPWLDWSRERLLIRGGGTNPINMPNDSPRGYESLGLTDFRKD